MIAPFPATTSRTSHPASEPSAGASPSRAADWGARIVQISLAIYLLPVLVLLFMIGGVGIAAVGLIAVAARVLRWGGRSGDVEAEQDALRP
jgi:hypothetical protein